MSIEVPEAKRKIIDYRMIWRWHFYAGLVCLPFIIILSITGPIYLFKPQIEQAIDARYDHLAFAGEPQSAAAMVGAALAANPSASFKAIEVRHDVHDASRITLVEHGKKLRVYVHPQSLTILKQVPEDKRFMEVVKTIHGELLTGRTGQVVVELAACWAIVMIVTGLYLWWPRNAEGLRGVLWPRFNAGSRIFWRDLHAVTGIYVSVFALFLLLTGLPWTYVWGNGFKAVREIGTPAVKQDWSQGSHADHHAMMAEGASNVSLDRLDRMVVMVRELNMPPPVTLNVPAKGKYVWTAQTDHGNRTLRDTYDLDPYMMEFSARHDFKHKPVVDKVVGIGISAHEGQLFGPLNQALGVLTALGLMTLCVSAVAMWWKRRSDGVLGAPSRLPDERLGPGLAVLIVVLAILLPVLGISLIVVGLVERLVLRRLPAVRDWLGLAA